ncbi:odorant receptor 4 isoform X1 [Galleria mellonella]|uniref:Odorant receptor n=1 Tax=Galleria mellonella TaxID=7137 RepID=A0A6J1X4J6_GALME|nr:odorant receptor 4 isoform X1 [Galleria mellonella]
MSKDKTLIAKKEIYGTLRSCNFFIRRIGLSFVDKKPNTFLQKINVLSSFITASSFVALMLISEYVYIVYLLAKSVTLEKLMGSYLHIAGYDTMSFGKLLTIWYKKNTFRRVVNDLADIWPVDEKNPEAVAIKNKCLSTLRSRQSLYIFWNVLGVWLYNLTPVALHLYRLARGIPSDLGFVWQMYYPFDKTKPIVHEFVYIFETASGLYSVCCMLSSDVFFITMASHISMMLRILQVKIRSLGVVESADGKLIGGLHNCYDEIIDLINVHQRLIRYGNDLEDAFSVVNLINVLLSSVNICCVMFSIIFLEPLMEMGNKFFIAAALTQMGVVCWYADDIYRASVGVSDAVFASGWYNCNPRCRRALLLMLQRSQRPLYFTALKFSSITLNTFRSILTTSYSYFTLLYTSYRRH